MHGVQMHYSTILWLVALCEAVETMVKLANKSVDRLLLSEYLGNYEKRGTKLKLRTSLTLTFPYFVLIGLI